MENFVVNICKIMSKNTGVIYKLSSFVPQEILLILYSTLICLILIMEYWHGGSH